MTINIPVIGTKPNANTADSIQQAIAKINAIVVDLDGRTTFSGTVLTTGNLSVANKALTPRQGIFNVLDYGADPTGAVDSQPAFQAAADAIAALGARGGTLFIPPGSFRLNTPVVYAVANGPLAIVGTGRFQSIIIQFGIAAFQVSGTGVFEMRNLFGFQGFAGGAFLTLDTPSQYILANIHGYTTGKDAYWDAFFNVINPLLGSISDVFVRNNHPSMSVETDLSVLRGSGFQGNCTKISVNNSFNNVYFKGFYYGIYLSATSLPGCEGTLFTNCVMEDVRIGVRTINTAYAAPQPVSWVGGHINAYERCFYLENCSDPVVNGALLYRNCAYNLAGQHIFVGSSGGFEPVGVSICNTTFRVVANGVGKDAGSQIAAIHVDGGSLHQISNNRFDLSPGFGYAVFANGASVDATLNKSQGSGLLTANGVLLTGANAYSMGNRKNGGTTS
jgi:hypothetical protein